MPTFGAPILTPTGGLGPAVIASADFNGDGNLDVVTANTSSLVVPPLKTLSILLGNGQGGFSQAPGSPITIMSLPQPFHVTVGDLNNDGRPDLVAALKSDGILVIFLGNGNGTFTPLAGPPVNPGPRPIFVALGNFTNDNFLDAVVVNASNTSSVNGSVTFLRGTGNGGLASLGPSIPVGMEPNSIAVGQFNNDASADFAVANASPAGQVGSVSVFLGDGNGSFTAGSGSPVAAGVNARGIVAAAFDGNSSTDLAVVNGGPNGDSGVTVLRNDGTGQFAASSGSPFATSTVNGAIAVSGDFNNDGRADVALASNGPTPGAGGSVAVLYGDGAGGLASPLAAATPIPVGNAAGLAAGDFNNDGLTDLAVTNPVAGTVGAILNQPSAPPFPIPTDPIERYVFALYDDVLDRRPDAPGFAVWVNALRSGALTRLDVARSFLTSTEATGLFVDFAYERILNRSADPAGRAHWVAVLEQGTSEAEVAQSFFTSPEYFATHSDTVSFVNGLYLDILERSRTPSLAESAPHRIALDNGTMTRGQIVINFLSSDEAYFRAIDVYYDLILERTPSPAEKQGWFETIISGTVGPVDVGAAFLASLEYFNKVTA